MRKGPWIVTAGFNIQLDTPWVVSQSSSQSLDWYKSPVFPTNHVAGNSNATKLQHKKLNPLKCSGVRWLHFQVFSAIQI